MKTNEILTANVLDIIFEGRNKTYGAYDLRITYNRRLTKAIFFTVLLMIVAILGITFKGMAGKTEATIFDVDDLAMTTIKEEKILPPVIPPPVKAVPIPQNQVKHTTPIIVQNDKVKEDEKIQEIHENQAIGSTTIVNDSKSFVIQFPITEVASNVIEAPKTDDDKTVFIKVEKEAEFPGGQASWVRYLQRNLNPNAPTDNGAPTGTYKVIVRFIVSKDGTISDVTAETKHGFGMEEEAVKIIKRGPNWTPANQNGHPVNAYRSQPIIFSVLEQ